jgi:hypothetical protein
MEFLVVEFQQGETYIQDMLLKDAAVFNSIIIRIIISHLVFTLLLHFSPSCDVS